LGLDLPKHLTDEVCEFLIVGTGYFDFKGRDGLIQKLKAFLPAGNYLLDIIAAEQYREPIEKLCALRNYAAHGSSKSKKAALRATGQSLFFS